MRAVIFWVSARVFGIRVWLREEKAKFSLSGQLARATLPMLLLGIVVAYALQATEWLLLRFLLLPQYRILESGNYVALLASVAGIGGVFIALYYTAVAMVGSATYTTLPNDIRSLLAFERTGSLYMRLLAFTVFLSVSLMGFHLLGFAPPRLGVVVVSLLAGVSVFGFIFLGKQAFFLFDPAYLGRPLITELYEWVTRATVDGFSFSDASFQAHYHSQASKATRALNTLGALAAKEEHLSGRSFTDLAGVVVAFLTAYQALKDTIPSSSRWYELRYSHPDWYLTSDSLVELAHRAGVAIQPKVVREKNWLEDSLDPILIKCLEVNTKEERWTLASGLLTKLQTYVRSLGECGDVDRACKFIKKVGDLLIAQVLSGGEAEEKVEYLRFIDQLALLPIELLLAYVKSLPEDAARQVAARLGEVQWTQEKSIYRQGFRSSVLPRLEWMRDVLRFETSVEGKIISPAWYQSELIRLTEVEELIRNVDAIVSARGLYQDWRDRFRAAERPWLEATAIDREREYRSKVIAWYGLIERTWLGLSADKRIEDLQWPEDRRESWESELAEWDRALTKKLGEVCVLLAGRPRPNDFPDFQGQFLHALGEAMVDALCESDSEKLRTGFLAYLYASLMQRDKLMPKEAGEDQTIAWQIRIALAPLIDLLNISGYAWLASELHNKPELWSEVATAWDEYLREKPVEALTGRFAASVQVGERPGEFGHRSTVRMGWRMRLRDCIRQVLGLTTSGRFGYDQDIVDHPSELVRIFAKSLPSYDGADILFWAYFRKQPGVGELSLGRLRDGFSRELDHERQRYEEWKDSGKEKKDRDA